MTPERELLSRVRPRLDLIDDHDLCWEIDALLAQPETTASGTAKVPEDYKALYMELLYAVGNKWPGESRHQTALRYITQAERGNDHAAADAAPSPEGNSMPGQSTVGAEAQDAMIATHPSPYGNEEG